MTEKEIEEKILKEIPEIELDNEGIIHYSGTIDKIVKKAISLALEAGKQSAEKEHEAEIIEASAMFNRREEYVNYLKQQLSSETKKFNDLQKQFEHLYNLREEETKRIKGIIEEWRNTPEGVDKLLSKIQNQQTSSREVKGFSGKLNPADTEPDSECCKEFKSKPDDTENGSLNSKENSVCENCEFYRIDKEIPEITYCKLRLSGFGRCKKFRQKKTEVSGGKGR